MLFDGWNNSRPVATLLQYDVIALYFGAARSPQSRAFTAKLEQVYTKLMLPEEGGQAGGGPEARQQEQRRRLGVLYIPGDHSSAEWDTRFTAHLGSGQRERACVSHLCLSAYFSVFACLGI